MLQMCYPQSKSCLTCNNFLKALHIQRLGRKRKPLLQPPVYSRPSKRMEFITFYDDRYCILRQLLLYYILRRPLLHFTSAWFITFYDKFITFYDKYHILRQGYYILRQLLHFTTIITFYDSTRH